MAQGEARSPDKVYSLVCREGKFSAYSLSLDGPLKRVARAEGRNFPSRDPHLLPRLWVPALTGLLLPNVELPKAHDLDLVPAFERLGHDLLEGIEVPLGLALRCVGLLSERLDQLCFVHRCSSL